MHNLFLGELKHHCVEVWGIDVKDKTGGTKKIHPHTPEQQKRYLEEALECLKNRDSRKLSKIRKGYLTSIAMLNGITPTPPNSLTKASYIKALADWVRMLTSLQIFDSPVLIYPKAEHGYS
uniref:N/A n=1 Tax=Ganoderma boninense TaxID=34458 RepID=A0A5K1K6T0_9APHY|nr:N/A [Ganoderma boninense]